MIFADGTFIDGSTSELSCDGPLREPFAVFCQVCCLCSLPLFTKDIQTSFFYERNKWTHDTEILQVEKWQISVKNIASWELNFVLFEFSCTGWHALDTVGTSFRGGFKKSEVEIFFRKYGCCEMHHCKNIHFFTYLNGVTINYWILTTMGWILV